MISQLITLLLLILILGLIWWAVTSIVPIPQPFMKVAQVILVLIVVLLIIGIFFGGYSLPLLK